MPTISWRFRPTPQGLAREAQPQQAASLATAAFLPQGAYTTLRSYGRTGALLFDKHVDRLEESSRLLGHSLHLPRAAIRHALCELLQAQQWEEAEESRVRLTLDCSVAVGDLWISLEPLTVPSAGEMASGVAVLTRSMQRHNPRAKDNAFLESSREARTLLGGRINEVLMVDPGGHILEGLSSNFFGVRRGTVFTAEEGVLPGLTRSLVLEEADRAGIPLCLEAILLEDVPTLDEAFVSSTSRAVLPVVEIDGQAIGGGSPGSVTLRLAEQYHARLAREVEPLCNS